MKNTIYRSVRSDFESKKGGEYELDFPIQKASHEVDQVSLVQVCLIHVNI